MSDLPKAVKIKEVGPREGFQFEKGAISLEDKISLVDALSDTGVASIEFTSFVSPKWVPQMADAEQMVAGIRRAPPEIISTPKGANASADRKPIGMLSAAVDHCNARPKTSPAKASIMTTMTSV